MQTRFSAGLKANKEVQQNPILCIILGVKQTILAIPIMNPLAGIMIHTAYIAKNFQKNLLLKIIIYT